MRSRPLWCMVGSCHMYATLMCAWWVRVRPAPPARGGAAAGGRGRRRPGGNDPPRRRARARWTLQHRVVRQVGASTPFATAPIPLGMGDRAPRAARWRSSGGHRERARLLRSRRWQGGDCQRGCGHRRSPGTTGRSIHSSQIGSGRLFGSQVHQATAATPFASTDTWDSIGVNLAIWNAAGRGEVFLPAGCACWFTVRGVLTLAPADR